MSRHEGVKCDACEANAFRLRRYKCLRCVDFDLCGPCYDRRAEALSHRRNHPMQCLILESDRKIFFPNTVSHYLLRNLVYASCFTRISSCLKKSNEMPRSYICPICGALGFKAVDLGAHVHAKHSNSRMGVLCPLCIYPPPGNPPGGRGSNPNRVHNCFSTHLSEVHRLKAPTSGAPTAISSNSSSSAAIETFLTRDPNHFYEPTKAKQQASAQRSRGRSSLSADEQELFDLVSASSTDPMGRGLHFRLQRNLSSSTSGQVSHSELVASSKVIERQADTIRREAGDEVSEPTPQITSQPTKNINNSSNNEGDENNGNSEPLEPATSSATADTGTAVEEVQGGSVVVPAEATSSLVSYGAAAAIVDCRLFEAARKKCDPVWLSFVHELIWDSLHIAGLSLTPSEGEKK
ncbi:E3 ubiquitin-protein ligase KCMF1 [Echinococcus granulosus]|uniref:RING-type E3 ubiquitin transferase n=1 Tax=Echinococcus granulosus TaxID=6210 RepID=W6U3V3_ECHGR|nr:E3 ubiquitin-protein ligase KCMF1 [Echinococcus granulosus]EUB55780.1 E3 ubiquitin-protein ligase KCMF1 [Echinococcus granulosus]